MKTEQKNILELKEEINSLKTLIDENTQILKQLLKLQLEEIEDSEIDIDEILSPSKKTAVEKDELNTIINSNDAELMYKYAKKQQENNKLESSDIVKITDAIIKTDSSKYIYLYVTEINEINITKCLDRLLELKDLYYCLEIAKHINMSELNVKKYQKLIVESKDINAIVNFAALVKGADTSELFKLVLDSNNLNKSLDLLFKNKVEIGNHNLIDVEYINTLEEKLIEEENIDYIIQYLNVENPTMILKRMENLILDKGTMIDLYRFAQLECIDSIIKPTVQKRFLELYDTERDFACLKNFIDNVDYADLEYIKDYLTKKKYLNEFIDYIVDLGDFVSGSYTLNKLGVNSNEIFTRMMDKQLEGKELYKEEQREKNQPIKIR